MTSSDLDALATAPSPFTVTCGPCQHANVSDMRFCEKCGSPLHDDVFDVLHAPALREARTWMGRVAVLYVIGGLLFGAIAFSNDPATGVGIVIINLMLAATQGGLWWWSKRAVFPAAVVSLALYVTVVLLDAVMDPMSLVRGWLIKILFIGALWKAIQAGLAVRRAQSMAQAS